MKLETETKLLRLNSILNKVSDTSYAYGTLRKKYHIANIDEEQASGLINAYEQLLSDVKNSLSNYEQ